MKTDRSFLIFLVILVIIAVLFVGMNCKLSCGGSEEKYNLSQLRGAANLYQEMMSVQPTSCWNNRYFPQSDQCEADKAQQKAVATNMYQSSLTPSQVTPYYED